MKIIYSLKETVLKGSDDSFAFLPVKGAWMYPLYAFLLIGSLLLTGASQAQSLKVCYIPDSRTASTDLDHGYTFDGDKMAYHSTVKLTNPANFGPNGRVKQTIIPVPLTDYPISSTSISKAECGAIFVGGFGDWDGTTLKSSALTDLELSAIREWSMQNVNNLVVITQSETVVWGYTNVNGNSNPNKPTDAGQATSIFNGPFGNVSSFNQGGSYQGSLSGGSSTVLAVDAQNRATIVLDIPTGDIILGDVDILTSLGGISFGNTVSNSNDILFANIWAYASNLTSPELSLIAGPNTVFLDNGAGGGTAGNCVNDGSESLKDFTTPLYVKLKSGSTITQIGQVQANGSFTLAGITVLNP